jgi:hypothetical protein
MPLPQSLAEFRILINGSLLVDDDDREIARISVEKDVNLPGYFEVELVSRDSRPETADWIDDQTFAPGNEVRIEVMDAGKSASGPTSDPSTNTLIIGEITGLEPGFYFNLPPSLVIRGYDYLHRLQGSSLTRSFLQSKDSQIATQIAAEVGLDADARDSKVIYEYLVQTNQTNLHFLQTRAERIGYNLYVDGPQGKTLFFQPMMVNQSPELTLKLAEDLQEFTPCLRATTPSTQVVVKGWNFKQGQAVTATAASASSSSSTSAIATVVDRPCMTVDEARQQAEAQARQEALHFIEAEGIAWERADIRLAKTIRIEGLGARFSGLYYVTGVNYRRHDDGQFYTHFRVRSNNR